MSQGSEKELELLQARVKVPEHVVFRSFVAETVLLNIETCRYHGLNPTGGSMFKKLADTGDVGTAAAHIAEEYGAPLDRVQTDIVALCEQLAEKGLLIIEGGAGEN